MGNPPNRLIHTTSPYLLQHAHNPVDWYPWGEEALTKAHAEDKPIFLSIGYSACHWCHVMERESFEDESVAGFLNAHFVSIKVDREERPDLDDIYMSAVQAITGRGGWPMSVWLTPDLRPFYGGTYFPPTARYGSPGFLQILERIQELWVSKRENLSEDARRLAATLQRQSQIDPGSALPDIQMTEAALEHLRRTHDETWGGFGPAPKFPPFLAIDLILRRGSKADRSMAIRTLDAMADGGIYDHLGGGFARYSVDARWLVPHFEKMLYDNAQLVVCYLSALLATGEKRYASVARETLDYLLRDLRDEAGGFYSSEDADSDGEEGKFYVFTPDQVRAVLAESDAALFCEAFGITKEGNFEGGTSVLHRFSVPSNLAERWHFNPLEWERKLGELREKMLQARSFRVRPHRDEKILTAWNGLTLSALAKGAQVLREPKYLEAATHCAEFLQRELWKEGVLLRTWRAGRAHTPAFLEDYGAMILGLLDLYETCFEVRWLRWAETLAESLITKFEDREFGGFFFTESGQSDVLFRQKPAFDGAIPSANALAALALLRLAVHMDRNDFRQSAIRTLQHFSTLLGRAPRAVLGLIASLEWMRSAGVEIVVAGDPADPRTQALLQTAWGWCGANKTVSLVSADPALPMHIGRTADHGIPAAYLCMNQACLDPIQDPDLLLNRLSEA